MHHGIVDYRRGNRRGRVCRDKGKLRRLLELLRDYRIGSCQRLTRFRSHQIRVFRRVELFNAQFAAPRALWWRSESRRQAVHVVAAIAIVAEEQLIVVIRGAANGAELTLDALPTVPLNGNHHVGGELEAGGMPRPTAIAARHQLLGSACFLVFASVSQTEIAIR